MPRRSSALTVAAIRAAKPGRKPVKLSDGEGMYLLLKPDGSRYWRMDYRFDGKRKTLALGVYPQVTLTEARARRETAREQLAKGRDPAAGRQPRIRKPAGASERVETRRQRLLQTIATVSELLLADVDEQALMQHVCETLAHDQFFRMAWVASVDTDGVSVRPVAQAGFAEGYLDGLDIRCDTSPQGRGPTGTAIRRGKTVVNHDIETNRAFAPWRERARELGFRSSAATPVRRQNRVIGALNVYSAEPQAFGADEILLLEKLAADLGMALERRTAERALRESEAMFRLLLESSPEAIFGVDTEGVCTFVNPACLRMLGYAREEDLVGKAIHPLIHHTYPDGRPYPKEQCHLRASTLQGKSTHVDDEVHWRADGTSFPVEYWSRPMYRDGQLIGAVVNFVDITERRQAERALRESEERYRLISSVANDLLYSCVRGADGIFAIDWATSTSDKVFGYSLEEIRRNACWRCYVHPDDMPVFERNITGLQPGETSVCELRIIGKDGAVRYIRAHSRVENEPHDNPGRTHRLYGSCQDITARKLAELAVRESEARYRDMAEQSADWVWAVDAEGRNTYSNRNGLQILGYDLDEYLDIDPATMVHPDDLPVFQETFATAVKNRTGWRNVVLRWRHHDGSYRIFESNATALFDAAGNMTGFQGIDRDITERKHAETALRASEARFRAMAEQSVDLIWAVDKQGRHTYANRNIVSLLGYDFDELAGTDPSILVHPDDQALYRETHDTAVAQKIGWRNVALRWRHRNGSYRVLESTATPLFDEQGELVGFQGIDRDITERRAAEERIEYLAHHDVLTGLPNRILLHDRFEHALRQADRDQAHVAMLFLDLDNFKIVNDTLGHALGDKLLQAVVTRIAKCMRDTDTVCRQGGDEFILLLNDIPDLETVERVAGDILGVLTEPFEVDRHVLTISCSIGVSLYPEDGKDFNALLQKADAAMYNAKEAGRNTYRFFSEAMNQRAHEHLLLQNRMHQALSKGEFSVEFQPQLDLISGRVVGAEALLRWNSAELGPVSPARFIPVAEDSGFIVPLGAWVLREACRQAQTWRETGLSDLGVSVNLSALQFRRDNLVDTVTQALRDSGLPPQLLELELTESILLQNVEITLATVQHLKSMGVRLAIDDFGTGYSSLSYLKRFTVDKLKIDQSFVRDIGTDPDDAAIVRAIIQMAKSLRLEIIAEGVETAEQVAFLRAEGCGQIQGYCFSRPLPPERFLAFMLDHPKTLSC